MKGKAEELKLAGKTFTKLFGWWSWIKKIQVEFMMIVPENVDWDIDIKWFEVIVMVISFKYATGIFKIAIH